MQMTCWRSLTGFRLCAIGGRRGSSGCLVVHQAMRCTLCHAHIRHVHLCPRRVSSNDRTAHRTANRRVRRSSRLTGRKRRLGGSEGEDDGTAGLSDSDLQDLYDDDGDEEYGAAGLEDEGDGDSAWSSSGLEEEDEGSGEVGPAGWCWSFAP